MQKQQQIIDQALVWKPFSLTYITYPIFHLSDTDSDSSDDGSNSIHSNLLRLLFPQLMALLSLFPIFFICALSSSSIVYKDVLAAYLLVGTVIVAGVTSVLKEMIGESRPPSPVGRARNENENGDDDDDAGGASVEYGMPSNHSSVAFFGATFVVLYVLFHRGKHRRRQHQPHWRNGGGGSRGDDVAGGGELLSSSASSARRNGKSSSSKSSHHSSIISPSSSLLSSFTTTIRVVYHHLHTTLPALSAILIASGCAYSRVYLQYHTWNQVIVGSLLGIGCGVLWYALFTMEVIQKKLRWMDGMIEELEMLERSYWICDNGIDGENDDDDERKSK
ncbi:hypothetical protein ACHAWU_004373 [Discostella pseudostelligera]|uniref:Phosphatidic acid phosphatase type 2/haloperoxidase domain-containing protein n=1 Tax=Discostella pseudostelligera TaxID=259834 RepID=A0ABD3N6S9_9STRA